MNVKNKAIKASNQTSNCPHGLLIIHQMFQRAVCKCQLATLVTSGMKNPPKKLEFSQVLPRFWF